MFDDFEVLATGCQRGTKVEQRVPKWDFGVQFFPNAINSFFLTGPLEFVLSESREIVEIRPVWV